jgi:DNA repair exonuclease SbcCD ATPase subunit
MEIQLNTSSVSNLASVAEALKSESAIAAETAPILSSQSLNVTESSPDLESLLSKLLMETNEAKLNAARSRLASALDQLTNLGEADKQTVGEMRDLAAQEAQAEATLEAKSRELDSAAKELNSAEKTLDSAKDELASAEKAFLKAETKYAEATKALEDYLSAPETADRLQVAALEADVASAKQALDSAGAKVDAAGNKVASAEKRVADASAAHGAAQEAYDAAADEVSSLQTKFDRLLDSLDASSLSALRDAIRLDAGDVDHLHEEIEKDDEEHDLASVKAVEDVIADALDRMDGKMVDEVADRHLDHI